MADSVIGSKEIAMAVITFVLANVVKSTGIDFPLTPDQIYAGGLAATAMIRVFWTSGKIQGLLPKKPEGEQ